jgi:hypothetical protein
MELTWSKVDNVKFKHSQKNLSPNCSLSIRRPGIETESLRREAIRHFYYPYNLLRLAYFSFNCVLTVEFIIFY